MLNQFGLFALFTLCMASSVLAQEQTSTVTGIVVDSDDQPVSGVLVFLDAGPGSLDEGSGSATTGAVGAFRLEGVTAGPHLLNFRKAGLEARTYELVFAANEDRRDVGVVLLQEGRDPTATFTGTITGGVSGEPIGAAVVKLNGDVVALTDGDGVFLLSEIPIAWGSNEFEVGRFAFTASASDFWIVNLDEMLDFSVMLDPIPIDVAPSSRVSARLQPFYDRLGNATGQFITRSDIEAREPTVLTDLLRGVSGVRLRPGPNGMVILLRRPSETALNTTVFGDDLGCGSPLIFFDGRFLGGGARYANLDDLVDPDQVEGIEIYGGDRAIPDEFDRLGRECGVIAVWTR